MTLTRETRIGLLATFCTLTAFALSSNAIPPVITTIAKEFGVQFETFGGYIVLLQFSVFATASIIGGWLTHRFGITNRALIITGVVTLSFMLAIGSTFSRFAWFVVWAVPLGFAGGLVETFSSILVCKFGGRSSSKMLNLSQVFFCFGALFAPFLAGRFLGWGISWRITFLTLGILIFIIAMGFIAATRNLKEPAIEPAPAGDTPAVPAVHTPILSDPMFYLLAIALFLYVVVEGSIVVWVPTFFEKKLNVPASSAAWRLSLFWFGLVCGRSSMLVLRGSWTLWPAVIVGSVGMMIADGLMIGTWSVAVSTCLVFSAGLLSGPLWPIIVTLSQNVRQSPRFTSGVIAAGAVGAGLGPYMSSLILRYLGLKAFFPILTGLGLLLVVALIQAKIRHQKER